MLPPIFTVVVAYIGEEWPPAQAMGVMGVYMAATSVGGFCGPVRVRPARRHWSAGALASSSSAAMTLACGLAVAAILPRERNFMRSEGLAASGRQMLRHLRNPQLLATYAVGFGTLFNFVALFTYVNFVLAAPPFNLSPTLLGAIFVTYLAGAAAVLGLGRAIARFGRRPLVIGAIGLWIVRRAAHARSLVAGHHRGLAVAACGGFIVQATSTGYVALTARERTYLGDRILRHELLRRRQHRRGLARTDLEHRRLARLRRDGDRDAGLHGGGDLRLLETLAHDPEKWEPVFGQDHAQHQSPTRARATPRQARVRPR